MFGSIESQTINSVLTEIFNIKFYPSALIINEKFECAILLSEYYTSQSNYIDEVTLGIIKKSYQNKFAKMYSLDSYLKGISTFERVYSGQIDKLIIDSVCEEMQCYSFLINLPPNDYIIGLNEEVVIFISKKKNGIIHEIGGIDYFKQLFNKQREQISTPLDHATINNLSDIFYKKS